MRRKSPCDAWVYSLGSKGNGGILGKFDNSWGGNYIVRKLVSSGGACRVGGPPARSEAEEKNQDESCVFLTVTDIRG